VIPEYESIMNAWSELPNAAHIDAVLAHLRLHPDCWSAARGVAWDTAIDAAWNAAGDAVGDAARGIVWDTAGDAAEDAVRSATEGAVWSAAKNAARGAARGAVLALIAYDDCAHFLAQPVESVRVSSRLGVPSAFLLLPACIAMRGES
jgi:hypothetical protein